MLLLVVNSNTYLIPTAVSKIPERYMTMRGHVHSYCDAYHTTTNI